MGELIQLRSFPDKIALKKLLIDKTTKKNIIWATKSYENYGPQYSENHQITIESITGLTPILVQPRTTKALEQQKKRTKVRAEVFTPSWICNMMNNHCDEEWFGRKNVFNIEKGNTWEPTTKKIVFPEGKTWQQYIDSRRVEITCGEAPYLVSRYDTTTGEIIDIKNRIGILDRKLRIVNENITTEEEWLVWVYKAFQSVYGYEFQGDNLLIGRINMFITFIDYLRDRWHREPTAGELRKLANIIAWNLWQMDGLTKTIPMQVVDEPENHQNSLFENVSEENKQEDENKKDKDKKEELPICRIYDWKGNHSILFTLLEKSR